MNSGKYVFAQVLQFVNRYEFEKFVSHYRGNYRVKKLYHLGIKQNVNQSTLSRANESRDWRIFTEFGEYLIKTVRPLYANCSVPNVDIDNDVFALDSTTISLSIKRLR